MKTVKFEDNKIKVNSSKKQKIFKKIDEISNSEKKLQQQLLEFENKKKKLYKELRNEQDTYIIKSGLYNDKKDLNIVKKEISSENIQKNLLNDDKHLIKYLKKNYNKLKPVPKVLIRGAKGGVYYINSVGKKVYLSKKKTYEYNNKINSKKVKIEKLKGCISCDYTNNYKPVLAKKK